jgi:Carboxypeptidase regulatory-like domain
MQWKKIWIVVVFLLLPSMAMAQGNSATIGGQIVDASGAAISGAKVTLKNLNTGLVQATASNDEGIYSVPLLPPGSYSVRVEREGFRTGVQTGILLTVGQVATVNVSLQPGQVSETVTVDSDAELINTVSADISSVINQKSVQELPLNGRDPSSLVLLTTGVTNILNTNAAFQQSSNSFPNESGASSGGGRQGSTFYLLDGASNMDNYLLLAAPFPNADATQEFRVISNNFDVQYGFSPGAVVSIQTRSGSNEFHGGVFEFLRNNDLNAANYFSHQVDSLKRNQFGGYAGGPILKDKLFLFANYQGTRARTTPTANATYTPTQAMLNGDFSAVPIALKAPFKTINGKPNQIDPALFSPAAYSIATTALPLGQDPATGLVNYVSPPTNYNYDEGTSRLDFTPSSKQRLYLRSFINYYQQLGAAVNGNLLALSAGSPGEYYNEVLGDNWIISPNTVNNLILSYSQMSISSEQESLDKNGQPVCMSRYINVSEIAGHCYFEGFSVTNGFSSNWDEPVAERRNMWGLSDSILMTRGKHSITVGVDVRKQFAQENTDYPATPIINFNGSFTGFGLADYLLGYVYTYNQGAGEIASVKGWQLGLYAEDQYRVRPNFTVTAGIRWDPNIPPASTGGRGAAFRPGQQSTLFPNAPLGVIFPGDKGLDSALMPTTWNYWEPRIGISWQPSFLKNTSVRAGFGLFTGPLPYSYYNHMADVAPFSPTFLLTATGPGNIPFDNPWLNYGPNPFPPFAALNYKPPTTSTFQLPMTIPANFASDFRLGMTQSWSFSIEQQLMQNLAIHMAYVGSGSYHQTLDVDQNPGIRNVRLNSGFGQVLTNTSWGTSQYHSLQVGIDKRLSHGFQIQSNFTWSKVIDVASTGNISQGNSWVPNPFNIQFNRGISDLNVPLISITNFVYTSPALRGRNALVRGLLGSWEVSAIYTLQSGKPFSIAGGDGNNNSGSLQNGDRADVVPGVSPQVHQGSKQHWVAHYINPGAFQANASGTFGNSGRNIFRAPGINTADSALVKNWQAGERYGIQFRWEMFNTFNHTSFNTPNNDPTASNFGQITKIGPIAPRVMQAGLKLTF